MAEDGWTARRPWRRGRVVGHAPGMAGAGRRPRRRGTALACGWRWDPALVFLGARPRARPLSSGPRGGARVPVPRPPPCVLAGPSPPPPASSSPSSRACDRPRSRPLPGPEPASPRLTWVSSPGLCRAGGVPGRSSALGSPERGGRGGEPGAREGRGGGGRRCAAGECSPRAGCGSGGGGGGGREPREGGGASPSSSRVVPRDRPCAGRASGGEIPRWAPAADSRPLRRVALGRSPRGGARPPHLRHRLRGVGPARPHPVGAPLRPSVRPPRSPRRLLLPGAVCPGVPRFPGPPRPRSVARVAAAAAAVVACWTRGRPRPDALARARDGSPVSPPPRGPVAVSSPPGLPRPALGWVDGRTPRARVGRPRRGGPGRAGWRREKGGWPAALLLPPHHPGPPPRASRAVAAARRDPRGPEGASRGRASSPRAGPGRSGLPARRAPFPTPPPASGLPHLTGGGGSPSRLAPLPPAPTGTPGSSSSCSLPPTWLILPVAYACLKD